MTKDVNGDPVTEAARSEIFAPQMVKIEPRDFSHLVGQLSGISDRMLLAHFATYYQAVDHLNALEAQYAKSEPTKPPAATAGLDDISLRRFFQKPIGDLDLKIADMLEEVIDQVQEELNFRGITFRPNYYLGEADFWTADRAISINVPWFLADSTVWTLVNEQTMRYTRDDLLRTMRHEVGHAIGYAFEIWKKPEWTTAFGDFKEPYRDAYTPDPESRDFVRHLHHSGPRNIHYAQKHPDEDWAETFATWLDIGSAWRRQYRDWPGALAKLLVVDKLISDGALAGEPPNKERGKITPYTQIRSTVGEFVGEMKPGNAWSQHTELLRREPHQRNAVVLHEIYFEQFAPDPHPPSADLVGAIEAGFGSFEDWLRDVRSIIGSTDGWALAVWDGSFSRVRNALVEQDGIGVPAGCQVLLAIDCHEHAYAMDYGSRRDVYTGAVFRNLDWRVVSERFLAATGAVPRGPAFSDEEMEQLYQLVDNAIDATDAEWDMGSANPKLSLLAGLRRKIGPETL